jgi:hypothetical protein
MANSSLPDTIPVTVHLSLIQSYNSYLCLWQSHAEAERQESQFLRGRTIELEKENEELRDIRNVLQQIVDMQRELVTSLEADLARANAESKGTPNA